MMPIGQRNCEFFIFQNGGRPPSSISCVDSPRSLWCSLSPCKIWLESMQ